MVLCRLGLSAWERDAGTQGFRDFTHAWLLYWAGSRTLRMGTKFGMTIANWYRYFLKQKELHKVLQCEFVWSKRMIRSRRPYYTFWMRLDVCLFHRLYCLLSILCFGGRGLLACLGRPCCLVPRSISWVNERWAHCIARKWALRSREVLISITMPAPAPVPPCVTLPTLVTLFGTPIKFLGLQNFVRTFFRFF